MDHTTTDTITWTRFCNAIDAHRRELAKIQRKNRRMETALRAYVSRQLAEKETR